MARSFLITAGPTQEPIDDVRFIANRSSGAMGIALAKAAHRSGNEVTLLLGPVGSALTSLAELKPVDARRETGTDRPPYHPEKTGKQGDDRYDTIQPAGIRTIRFSSTSDLEALLDEWFPQCDVLIMAAAVADFRPVRHSPGKIERGSGILSIEMEPTPDLVAHCCRGKRPSQIVIGFALEEPGKLSERAAEKLRRKGLDAIVANPLTTMGSASITATIHTRSGEKLSPAGHSDEPMEKDEFAGWLVEWIDQTFPLQRCSAHD